MTPISPQPNPRSRNRSVQRGAVVSHVVLLFGALVMLAPFIWMVDKAFRPSADAFNLDASPFSLSGFTIENFIQAFRETNVLRYMVNGVLVCTTILFCQICIALPCAYALAKLNFRGRQLLFAIVIAGLIVPFQALSLPLFIGLNFARALDSYFALVFPFVVSTFAIFLLRQFIISFPNEVIQAARLDGFTEIEIIGRIILPATVPALAAFSVFSIIGHWNDLYWPMIVISSSELATPPLGVMIFSGGGEAGDRIGPLMAISTLVTAPLMLFFFFAQRRFVQGITMTGIK